MHRNRQFNGRARSGDLARDERRAAGLGPDIDARGGKGARERDVVRTALTEDRRRSVVRGGGDVIALLRPVIADLRPRAVQIILERYRAFSIATMHRNRQFNGRTRSGDLARDEGCAAGLGPDIDARQR